MAAFNLTPEIVAEALLTYTLKEIIELQTCLAKQGIGVTFQTGEFVSELPDRYDPTAK